MDTKFSTKTFSNAVNAVADKILDSIAGSEPVQSIMKPLEEPVNRVGGMIDQVTDGVTGMIDDAEKTTLSSIGSGAKLMQAMGIGGQGSAGGSGKGGNTAAGGGQAKGGKGDSKGGKKGGGGDFFGTIKSGIHENLMELGSENLKKLGTQILQAGVAKVTSAIKNALTPKAKFKLGNEEHELWVAKGQNRNVVMMASADPKDVRNVLDNLAPENVKSGIGRLEQSPEDKVTEAKVKEVAVAWEAWYKGHANASEAPKIEAKAVQEWNQAEIDAKVIRRVNELRDAIPEQQKGRITMGYGIALDASGNQISLVGTSEPNGYLRKGVTLKPGEILTKGTQTHAEVDIVNYTKLVKLKLISIGETRPVCQNCTKAILPTGAKIVTPLK